MLSKGRVLLVDDEPLVLEMFESVLSQEGFDVYVAPNAKEALGYLDKTFFDVLVCDVRLEDLDGFDIMAIARKKYPSIGAVLITGAPSETDSQAAERQNAAYLSKPIGFDLLVTTVSDVMNSSIETAKRAQL